MKQKHKKELDQILQEALSPDKEPNEWLNQKILRRAKEMDIMGKKLKRRIHAAAFVAAIALSIGTVSVVSAWNYLAMDKVAEIMGNDGLKEAFKSKDAVTINESQIFGNYNITLLGMVSGKNISKYVNDERVGKNQTYVVTAIENVDGTLIDYENVRNVVVSPLVKGLKPWKFNIFYMGRGCETMITAQNAKVMYTITECDSIEKFADKGVYISISDNIPSADAYQFNEKTGEITRNESYKGINALFNLPIDESKADPEAAEEYLKEREAEPVQEYELYKKSLGEDHFLKKIEKWDGKKVEKNAKLIEELTQVLTPNKDGEVTIAGYNFKNSEVSIELDEEVLQVEKFFKGKVGEPVRHRKAGGGDGDGTGSVIFENCTLNKNGTVTVKVYQYNEDI